MHVDIHTDKDNQMTCPHCNKNTKIFFERQVAPTVQDIDYRGQNRTYFNQHFTPNINLFFSNTMNLLE